MFHIGVDLAWGRRAPTGLAVLDAAGTLVHAGAVRTDEEILTALASYVEGDCLVAVDAPLVVRNATGNRPAEAALNRDFARFDAGAHPVNTSKPELLPPRASLLAAAFSLDPDPGSGSGRRVMEVYPHAATVALFRLGRTLKYKNKPGRVLDGMRTELLALMRHLETLHDVSPRLRLGEHWPPLRAAVAAATRKSELRAVEDQVDALLCAYVGRYADARPDDITTYGDRERGCIVTPTLPTDLRPTPRTS